MSPAFWPYSCPHFHRSLYACKVARARRCTAFSHWEPCYADLGPWGAWRAVLSEMQVLACVQNHPRFTPAETRAVARARIAATGWHPRGMGAMPVPERCKE